MANARWVIVTAGPTGSGKGALWRAAADTLRVHVQPRDVVLVDELVQRDRGYKESVRSTLAKVGVRAASDREQLARVIEAPPLTALEQLSAAYKAARTAADAASDAAIHAAMGAGRPLVVETTGRRAPKWLFALAERHRYRVALAYTLVGFCELVARVKGRALDAALAFLADPTGAPAPRLPDPRLEKLGVEVRAIGAVLLELVRECFAPGGGACPAVAALLLFENNGDRLRLLHRVGPGGGVSHALVDDAVQVFMRVPRGGCAA